MLESSFTGDLACLWRFLSILDVKLLINQEEKCVIERVKETKKNLRGPSPMSDLKQKIKLCLLEIVFEWKTHYLGFSVKTALNAMIYPPGSNPDHNPLHVLCCNDTCSFTWTGAEHINQDIFECRTCGLIDSLCCCTECARVCHKVTQ